MKSLGELRAEIDGVDHELCRLLARRFELTDAVAEAKRRSSGPVCVPAREREVLAQVAAAAGPGLADEFCAIFRTVMETSRARQSRRLAGEEGLK